MTPFPRPSLPDLSDLLTLPPWLVEELQRRCLLLINHVLQQEPQARERLKRHQGSVVYMQWRSLQLKIQPTAAGLLDFAPAAAKSDLILRLEQSSPTALLQTVMRGDKPQVHIEGNVQLAAEIAWLVDHVRWDMEEDLSRLIGDAPAHALAQAARSITSAVRKALAQWMSAKKDVA